jgi:8-oxo-dGTP pyrophosphatase MutT (NUDIX family)
MLFIKKDKILLGLKKRGFGAFKYNGFGGKLEPGETIVQAALREAKEESGLTPLVYEKVGIISFKDSYKLRVHLYVCTKWSGTLIETEEMKPKWFSFDKIPFNQMWSDDKCWMGFVLNKQKFIAVYEYEKSDDLTGTGENKIIAYKARVVETLK